MSIKDTLKELLYRSIINFYKININNINIVLNNDNYPYYSTDICKELKKDLNISYEEIFNKINNNLKKDIINTITITNEGIIKIFLQKDYLYKFLNIILEEQDNYGSVNIGNNKKINIEIETYYSDILEQKNLNSLIHIDTISRIMEYCGYNVFKEIYIKDQESLNEELINDLKKTLDINRIYIEKYSTNKDITDNYLIEDVLAKLRYTNKCYIDDNNLLIENIDKKSNKKYILINNNGIYSNFSKHLTHVYEKFNNDYQEIILYNNNLTNYNNNLIESIKLLNKDISKLKINISYDHNIFYIDDINKKRYIYMLENYKLPYKNNIDKITQVISKINKTIKKINNIEKYNNINDNITYNIINKLVEFKDIILLSCKYKEPILLINYLEELINLTYFIIDEEIYTDNTSNILKSSKIIINNIFKLLGLIPTEEL